MLCWLKSNPPLRRGMGRNALRRLAEPETVLAIAPDMEKAAVLRSCPDGRTLRLWLTPEGRDQLPPLHQALKHINQQLTSGFSAAELDTVARWLRHVQQIDVDRP